MILTTLHVYILKFHYWSFYAFFFEKWKLHKEKLLKICVFPNQYKFIFQYFRPGTIAFYSIKYYSIYDLVIYIFYFQCDFQFNIKFWQKTEAIVMIIKILDKGPSLESQLKLLMLTPTWFPSVSEFSLNPLTVSNLTAKIWFELSPSFEGLKRPR